MNRTQKKDLEGYAFIRDQILQNGIAPSLRQIGSAVGHASPRSVQLMLARLQERGFLSYVGGVIKLAPRNEAVESENTVAVPLVGSAACGLPTLAEQDIEAMIQVSTRLARAGGKYFLLRAKGNSMDKSGINDGDLVLVRQQPIANVGEKVVALIDNEATIKHFYPESEVVILKPNSTDETHHPIVLSKHFSIQGVVVTTIQNPF